MSTLVCDHRVSGVIITRGEQYLLFDRATFPAGVAPPCGHVDGHGDGPDGFEAAARAEVEEEVGLTVTGLRLITGGYRPNRCRRTLREDAAGPGHLWSVYAAEVSTYELRPSLRETRNARWLVPGDLQTLAWRTLQYARGQLTEQEWQERPGMEPVWVAWFCDARAIRMPFDALDAIDDLAARLVPTAEDAQ